MASTKVTETIREVINILKEDVECRGDKVIALILHNIKKDDWSFWIGIEWIRINNITLDDMVEYKEVVEQLVDKEVYKHQYQG